MPLPKISPKLRGLLKLYVQARIDESWKGGSDPREWPEIQKRLNYARQNLFIELNKLESGVHGVILHNPEKKRPEKV